jgi:hypothetical protein
MARPKKVNPNGTTRMVSVLVAQETYDALKAEANQRGISFGDLLRERLTVTVPG